MRPLTLALLLCALGCSERIGATVKGLQSFRITMVKPAADQLGSPAAPITLSEVVVDVEALGADGKRFEQDIVIDVFLSFAGQKLGKLTACGKNDDETPLANITLTKGLAQNKLIKLERAYGKTELWFESPDVAAAGSSPSIYFPNPTIPDVNLPLMPGSPTATYCIPFAGKHVTIDHATGKGDMVVTSVFTNGFVVGDSGAPFTEKNGVEGGGYNHMFVFSFGKPPLAVVPGRILAKLSGNVSKFVGFTELNFPIQSHTDTVNPALVPPPYELKPADRGRTNKLVRLVAATVKVTGKLCPIDQNADDWRKFNNFGIDLGGNVCDPFATFRVALPAKTLGTFDPLAVPKGATLTAVGMLRNFSGQNEVSTPSTLCVRGEDCVAAGYPSAACVEGTCRRGAYNFWTINPRDQSDIKVN